jgi:hydroxypyruvate isomerase
MLRFAANLTLLYTEHGFLDRFAAAAADGFDAVECQFPYDHPAAELRHRLDAHGLQPVLFNAPPGEAARRERGLACLPGREVAFRASIETALAYADVLRCPRVHVMSGLVPDDTDEAWLADTLRANLAWAAAQAAPHGVELLIEPLNRRDNPGYFLHRQAQAHAIVAEVGAANLRVQMDLYHCQVAEGDVSTLLRTWLPTGRVGHLQIAGAPDRHEPDVGELHYPYLFDVIEQLGWAGWIGCEYLPLRADEPGGTRAGLGWLRSARAAAGRGL